MDAQENSQTPAGFFGIQEWVRSGFDTALAMQQVAWELAVRQNRSAAMVMREKLSPPWSGRDGILSEIAGSALENLIAAGRVGLAFAGEQTRLIMAAGQNTPRGFASGWLGKLAAAMEAAIDLHAALLDAAEAQTQARRPGAGAEKRDWASILTCLVRESLAGISGTQARLIEIFSSSTPRPAEDGAEGRPAGWAGLAGASVHSLLDVQKKLLDLAGRQFRMSTRSAGRAMNFRISLLDVAGMAAAAEAVLLRTSPAFYGYGLPRGDGSAVILIPGFMGTDLYLMDLYGWLHRLGYKPFFSGIGLNAECPNLLIQNRLNATLDEAVRRTGRKVHLVGHSLGGMIARSVAAQRPWDVASVITLAAPLRGAPVNSDHLRAAEFVRKHILLEQGENVLPECYTGRCSCPFATRFLSALPSKVARTAIYSRTDRVVHWRHCATGDPASDFEVPGTHLGLVFNPAAYEIIATRLADTHRANRGAERNRRRKAGDALRAESASGRDRTFRARNRPGTDTSGAVRP